MEIKKLNKSDLKYINNMAFPIILNNLLAMLMDFCIQAMVGRLTLNNFAEVSVINTTIYSITGVLGMVSMAFNILGSRYRGRKDETGLRQSFLVNLFIDFILGILFFMISILAGKIVLSELYGFRGAILDETSIYLNIYVPSIGLNLILFTFGAYFKIINKTKYTFYVNLVVTAVNILMNYILVFGKFGFPRMNMNGAAVAAILSLTLNLIIYLFLIKCNVIFRTEYDNVFNIFKDTVKITIPLMGQEVLESTIVIIFINSVLSHIGMKEVSIYNLLFLLISLAYMPMYGYAQTSLTIVSKIFGTQNKDKVKVIPKVSTKLSLIFYAVISGSVVIFNKQILNIITNNNYLITGSIVYLIIALLSSILNIPATIYKYCLQGIGDEKWVFLSSILINIINIGLIYIFGIKINMKLNGVYLGLMINYLILTVAFSIRYKDKTL